MLFMDFWFIMYQCCFINSDKYTMLVRLLVVAETVLGGGGVV